jgi:hypothetical protein
LLISATVGESDSGSDMKGYGGLQEDDDAEEGGERIFGLGELVEFWDGTCVRGYRTDSGQPAFVKRVEGGGMYAIKMVGSGRGKYRQVAWRQLYKDGSFNKSVFKEDGVRVRGEARLKERAREEAEAKFGEQLRQTKRDLNKVENQRKEQEIDIQNSMKRQEIEARMAERERDKAERERLEKHKRQLKELGKEREQDMEEKNRDTRQVIRELRQELQLKEEELQLARQREVELQKKVIKERRLKERQKTAGETLQARFKEKTDSGERVIILEGKVKAKTRELSTLQKQYETTCETQEQEIQLLLQKRDLQAEVLSVCLYTLHNLFFVYCLF